MSLTETPTRIELPEWLVVQEMDRQHRIIDAARMTHDQLAREVGFERVRIEDVIDGGEDTIRVDGEWMTVLCRQRYVDPPGSWWRVTVCSDTDQRTISVDEGEFVSRQLPNIDEAF